MEKKTAIFKVYNKETQQYEEVILSPQAEISEAPADNKQYARKNGLWEEVKVPSKTSELTNDSGFLTSHQDISGKLDKSVYDIDKPTFALKTELPTAEDKAKWNGYDEEIKENARVTAGALVNLDEKTTCPQDDNIYAHRNKEWTDISNRLLPEPPVIGVRILHTNGKLFKESDWDQSWNSEAVGVYVGDDKGHRFIVAKTNTTPDVPQWGGRGTLIDSITTTTDKNVAMQDWNGKDNTDKIVTQLGDGEQGGNYAARLCKLYAFPGRWNGKGYLGSGAEWMLVYQNRDEINKCLLKCGGTQIDTSGDNWTSTQYNSLSAWRLYWSNGYLSYYGKNNTYIYARAFAPFEVEEYITKTELNKILNERLNIINGGHA